MDTASERPRGSWVIRLVAALVISAALIGCGSAPSADPTARGTVSQVANEPASAEASIPPSPEPSEPEARVYLHVVRVDSVPGVLLFGGQTSSPPDGGIFLGDSWRASAPPAWIRADPASAIPVGDALAYDAGSDRVVVFAIVAPGASFKMQNETWAYDPAADRWEIVAGEQPGGLHGARASYDGESDRIIVVAPEAARVWAYDIDSRSWDERARKPSGIGTYHGTAYDAESDRVVVFGGGVGSGPGTTASYDYNTDTWSDLSSDSAPPDRVYHAMAYDPGTDRIIMFGGVLGPSEQPTDETWSYDVDSNAWTALSPPVAPSPRGWASMAYNAADGTLVLFGGGPAREEATDETWIFDPTTDTWSEAGAP